MAGVILVTYQKKPADKNPIEIAGYYNEDLVTPADALTESQERVASVKKLPLEIVKMMYWWSTETHSQEGTA